MSKRRKIVGTRGGWDFRRPVCRRGHPPEVMIREPEGWTCKDCLDEWYADTIQKGRSTGGVELPIGVIDSRHKFSTIIPSRAARKAAGGGKRHG